jgi:hypothetical protein
MTAKNIDTSQSTFYFFLIILTLTIVKQYTLGSGSDITWALIFLFSTLISQYILNLYLTSSLCGSVQYMLAFYSTFVPWTIIFGTLQMLLILIPGWLRPFSNTFGYVAARLFGPEEIIKNIFKSPADKTQSVEALNHIYNDPSQIINELPTNKEKLLEKLTEMKTSGLIKEKIIVTETDKNIKDLLYILYLKDNVSYLIWYLLTGITVINVTKGYLLNSSCEQNITQMEEDYEDYLAQKAEEEQNRDDTEYNT